MRLSFPCLLNKLFCIQYFELRKETTHERKLPPPLPKCLSQRLLCHGILQKHGLLILNAVTVLVLKLLANWSWWKSISTASSLSGASALSASWTTPTPPIRATKNGILQKHGLLILNAVTVLVLKLLVSVLLGQAAVNGNSHFDPSL